MKAKEQRTEDRRKWREQEAKDIETAKLELLQEYGLERTAKFERAWEIAWNQGHAYGIEPVKEYFRELADLLSP